jgi:hypothetical protein
MIDGDDEDDLKKICNVLRIDANKAATLLAFKALAKKLGISIIANDEDGTAILCRLNDVQTGPTNNKKQQRVEGELENMRLT